MIGGMRNREGNSAPYLQRCKYGAESDLLGLDGGNFGGGMGDRRLTRGNDNSQKELLSILLLGMSPKILYLAQNSHSLGIMLGL